MSRTTASSVDEYIAGFPPETRKLLEELRAKSMRRFLRAARVEPEEGDA